jgi:hypothetical protein
VELVELPPLPVSTELPLVPEPLVAELLVVEFDVVAVVLPVLAPAEPVGPVPAPGPACSTASHPAPSASKIPPTMNKFGVLMMVRRLDHPTIARKCRPALRPV